MSKPKYKHPQKKPLKSNWLGAVVTLLALIAVVLLGLLAVSIMERRWESQRPSMVLIPIGDWEPDNAVWGQNYPREYESYLQTRVDDTATKYGGAFPRDYLEEDPRQVILFAGYGFSKEYVQARGHYHALEDVTKTKRLKTPYNAGTCMTCKSTDVPRLMDSMGVEAFYAANFHDLKEKVSHPIGCQDCHDPRTLTLRITRPALKEAFTAMGRDINQATHQDMRSLVCAQCHVEYYFKSDPKNYLTFPWAKGTTAENMIEYYDDQDFADYVHPISKVRIVKAQHPDFELFSTGVHAYAGLSCADCHMPYKSEGGIKFTDHHVQSPLLNVANSCAVCHRWEEGKLIDRVEAIQDKVQNATWQTEEALVKAHFDVGAVMQAGATDEQLKVARQLIRHAQFQWDYISASNGMGFHSPQESMRLLGESLNKAQEARLLVSRILASKGVTGSPVYPDYGTRERAWSVVQSFTDQVAEPIKLLP
jgi:nitrite reductase (cytochrome c-552)